MQDKTNGDLKKISIGIHFDSIGEVLGFPEKFHDPSFFSVMDRFLVVAARENFYYTIYVIGKDLLNKENARQVRKWSDLGHEIANHSWSHHVDLSLLPVSEVYDEIYKAHEIITQTTGVEPKGFVAPGWANSSDVYNTLISLKYEYDTSVFGSWLQLPQYLFWVLKFRGTTKLPRFLRRGQDLMRSIGASRKPYTYYADNGSGSLKILPIPIAMLDMACFHSLGFVYGWNYHYRALEYSLKKSGAFHYVMHTGDMVAPSDLVENDILQTMPRSQVSVLEKSESFDRVLRVFRENNTDIVTTRKLAASVLP